MQKPTSRKYSRMRRRPLDGYIKDIAEGSLSRRKQQIIIIIVPLKMTERVTVEDTAISAEPNRHSQVSYNYTI